MATATKASLKKCSHASNFITLISFCSVQEMLAIFLDLNCKRLCQSSGKEKWSCCLVITLSTKREIRHFQIIVMQCSVHLMYKKLCCTCKVLPIENLLLFCRSRWHHRHCCYTLKLPITDSPTSQNENYIPHSHCELEMPVNKQHANMNPGKSHKPL